MTSSCLKEKKKINLLLGTALFGLLNYSHAFNFENVSSSIFIDNMFQVKHTNSWYINYNKIYRIVYHSLIIIIKC
jgi:hypothetical protein